MPKKSSTEKAYVGRRKISKFYSLNLSPNLNELTNYGNCVAMDGCVPKKGGQSSLTNITVDRICAVQSKPKRVY